MRALGDLGNGTTVKAASNWVPAPVMGLTSGVISVSAGTSSACAVTASGGVQCWGENANGALGNDSPTTTCAASPCSGVPVPVIGLTSGVTAVSVGNEFACALTTGGGVQCWGQND
jgi:alpha-tubulin suppressor-like RCC1 family protein